MSIQQNIRFPEDLHAAISAEAERRGKPWTFSSVLIELAESAAGSLPGPLFRCREDGKTCLWGPCPPKRCRERVEREAALESMSGAARDGASRATAEAVGSLPLASASTRTPIASVRVNQFVSAEFSEYSRCLARGTHNEREGQCVECGYDYRDFADAERFTKPKGSR